MGCLNTPPWTSGLAPEAFCTLTTGWRLSHQLFSAVSHIRLERALRLITSPPHFPLATTTMSLEAVQKLSISELFQVLDGKLREEYFRVRETPLSTAPSATSFEPQVRTPPAASAKPIGRCACSVVLWRPIVTGTSPPLHRVTALAHRVTAPTHRGTALTHNSTVYKNFLISFTQ